MNISLNQEGSIQNHQNQEKSTSYSVVFSEIDKCNIKWDLIQFPIDLTDIDAIKESKTIKTYDDAVEIGTSIINQLHENGRLTDFYLCSIVHYMEDDIWRFDFSIKQDSEIENLVECSVMYIALDGESGSLIKSWITE